MLLNKKLRVGKQGQSDTYIDILTYSVYVYLL